MPNTFQKAKAHMRERQLDERGYLYCENCGKTTKELDAHHIVYRSERPKHPELNNERNLILLCRPCHTWFHDKKDRREQLMLNRNLKQLFDESKRNS